MTSLNGLRFFQEGVASFFSFVSQVRQAGGLAGKYQLNNHAVVHKNKGIFNYALFSGLFN